MSITKNRQPENILRVLCQTAFPGRQVLDVRELTEGMFNAAYRCAFADGTACILKVGPADARGLMSNEVNLMQAEVETLRLLRAHGVDCVPAVLCSDFSRDICDAPYFFMAELPGRSLSSCQAELPAEAVNAILREAGKLQRRTEAIRSGMFGLLGDACRFDTLHGLVRHMLGNVLRDAERVGVTFGFAPAELLARLDRDLACFDCGLQPSLVHMDMWEGNIFVHEGRFAGVIDWERALWGDPLMDDRFRSHNQHPPFLDGYGKTTFTPAEMRRIRWYDVYLYTTMLTESVCRQYGSSDMEGWLRHVLAEAWTALERPL